MTLRAVLAVLRARWYVVAVVLLATAVGGLHVKRAQPTYLGTAIVVLTPPKEETAPNKLTAVTPALAVTGLAVNTTLLDAGEEPRLRQDGVVGDYTITPRNNGTNETPQYSLPSELITVQTGDPNVALHSATVLEQIYAQQLQDLQSGQGIDPAIWITAQVLDPPTVQAVIGAHSRAEIGTALLGTGAAVVLPLWYDQLAARRRGRGRGRPRRSVKSLLKSPKLTMRRSA